MKKFLPIPITIFFSLFISALLLSHTHKTYAEIAGHVVISEVQIGGATSTDEFVELYNPTDEQVALSGWELMRKTPNGDDFTLVATLSGTISAHGYVLIAHANYDGTVAEDIAYSDDSISANNTIAVQDSSQVAVDKVGMGTAADFEGTAGASSPANNRSIERKALTDSSVNDMANGGIHELFGNGEDSDDNNTDFILRPSDMGSQPQNRSSQIETPADVSPSPSMNPSPTDEPIQTPTPTAEPSPTESPRPTDAPADNIVISEVQIGGVTATDEFIELYNPTDASIELTDWELWKKTASGTEFEPIVTLSGTIVPNGYYLAAHSGYDGSIPPDVTYSEESFSSNNTVQLVDGSGLVMDKVGIGTTADFEGVAGTSNPPSNRSIERKAHADSTAETMETGGDDEFDGNGLDTDDNASDFVLRSSEVGSQPQNSTSSVEDTGALPTPTPTPTETPSPTEEPSPSPTSEPTQTPTPSPTTTPTPAPIRRLIGIFPFSRRVCYLEYRPFNLGFRMFFWPRIVCGVFS